MIPLLGNTAALSGSSEGTQTSPDGAQGTDNKGIFGDILLAETTPSGGQADGSSGRSRGGFEGGNGLPPGGNALPASTAFPDTLLASPTQLDSLGELVDPDLLQLVSGEDISTQALSGSIATPITGLPEDVTESPLPPLEAQQQTPLASPLLTDTVLPVGSTLEDGAVLPAPSIVAPEADVTTPAPQLLATTTAGLSPAPPYVTGPAPSVLPAEPEGLNGLTSKGPVAVAQDLRGQAAAGVSTGVNLASDGAGFAQNNASGASAFTIADQQTVAQADEVLLESADTFGALDAGRGKPVSVLGQAQPAQGQPLAVQLAPTALEAAGSASKLPPLQPLSVAPGEPEWSGELAGRVAVMLRNGSQEASLQLNPPELGRLDIRIATEGDQARVQFAVHNADARDVIEQNMPRLRELLEQGGMTLARGEVADHSQNRRESEASMSGESGMLADEDVEPASVGFAVPGDAILDARVDYYV